MPTEETVAVSSPAEVEDVFQGITPTLEEFNRYRKDGELPQRVKPAEQAESATADAPEQTVETTEGDEPESGPDSDPEKNQELPPKTTEASKRIKQLLAENKELERKLAEKQDGKTESSPAQAPQYVHPKPTAEDKNPDGTPKYKEYEDVVEAIGRWAAKEERAAWEREHQQREEQKALQSKLDEARNRYDDADDVIFPANEAIRSAQIPPVIKEVIQRSPEFVDLLYVVGSDPAELKKFISLAQSDPLAALEKVFEYKRGIREELSKPRDAKGKFLPKEAPEVKKTSAPKPPSPVGGASSRAFDVSDDSLSTEEWMRQRNKQLGKV